MKGLCGSSELEGLLTSPEISGHRFRMGDGSRPSNLTYMITGNSLRLTTDIARRCYTIRPIRPKESATWKETMMAYILTNRTRIVMDMVAELQRPGTPPTGGVPADTAPLGLR